MGFFLASKKLAVMSMLSELAPSSSPVQMVISKVRLRGQWMSVLKALMQPKTPIWAEAMLTRVKTKAISKYLSICVYVYDWFMN